MLSAPRKLPQIYHPIKCHWHHNPIKNSCYHHVVKRPCYHHILVKSPCYHHLVKSPCYHHPVKSSCYHYPMKRPCYHHLHKASKLSLLYSRKGFRLSSTPWSVHVIITPVKGSCYHHPVKRPLSSPLKKTMLSPHFEHAVALHHHPRKASIHLFCFIIDIYLHKYTIFKICALLYIQ